jgi:transposase InsO family protein
MPWQQRNVVEQRQEFVIRAVKGPENLSALCREYGISRPTGYEWLRRYRKRGSLADVVDRSRRPHRSPGETASRIRRRIIAIRNEEGWGARKIAIELRAEGLVIPTITINRVLKRAGLVEKERQLQQATKRFERSHANELWQMDFKGEFRNGNETCFPLSILDDHSRFLVGLYALRGTGTEGVHRSLVDTFERHGLPDAILTDHGSPWWSTKTEHGLTRLSVQLIKQGIKLYYSGVGHPQTQGKVERFHRTLRESIAHHGAPKLFSEWPSALQKFRATYNERRPHEALQMKCPAQRYESSKRQYRPSPKRWTYPTGSEVLRVDAAGCIRKSRRQFFVSHCLVGEEVRVVELGRKLAVGFRHMWVIEINRKSGRGLVLLRPDEV